MNKKKSGKQEGERERQSQKTGIDARSNDTKPQSAEDRGMSNARTEFEKWAQFNFYPIAYEPNGVGLDGGPVYKDPRTHAAWCMYQWRQARGQAEPLTEPKESLIEKCHDLERRVMRQRAEIKRLRWTEQYIVGGRNPHGNSPMRDPTEGYTLSQADHEFDLWWFQVGQDLDEKWAASIYDIAKQAYVLALTNTFVAAPRDRASSAGDLAEAPEPNEQKPAIEREITTPAGEAS
jgi:hypothetical protein